MTHFECILLTFIITLFVFVATTKDTYYISKKMLKNSKQITFENGSIWVKINEGCEEE